MYIYMVLPEIFSTLKNPDCAQSDPNVFCKHQENQTNSHDPIFFRLSSFAMAQSPASKKLEPLHPLLLYVYKYIPSGYD